MAAQYSRSTAGIVSRRLLPRATLPTDRQPACSRDLRALR
jgi:hypothetical protein